MSARPAPFSRLTRAALAVLATLTLGSAAVQAQAPRPAGPVLPDAPGWEPARLIVAQERVLHSRITGRDYRIQLATNGPAPAGGYPVIYVLDGDQLFPYLAMLAQEQQFHGSKSGVLAVVGIGYPGGKLLDADARAHDYTPAPRENAASPADTGQRPGQPARKFGGAAQFQRFLQEELKPAIAQIIPVDARHQALMGHSFGGLFALHTLFTQPQSFSHYYISSPSIWWGDQRVLDDEKDLAQRLAALPATPQVRLTVGELEEPAATAPTAAPAAETADPQTAERTRRQQSRRMVSSVRELSQRLAGQRGLHVQTHIYPGRTHGSVILPALDDNLRQFWRDLQNDEPPQPPQRLPEKAPRP